ncbi:expressed unknown protein [Seminavis robusta]|uniref:DUF4116 domain-containing protein n=1 Tax=Seminavis robusta TaxID=568900 RepID=A0A9N8DFV1_9STRA|nr:expressed unknown protein [Seminavis robusta]|eukprot:Sro48_g028240.1 n/a (180) ;mRNA; r:69968-70507
MTNRSFSSQAVQSRGNLSALEYAAEPMVRDDKDVVLAAVRKNGLSLRHASEALRRDKEIVLAAVSSRPDALKYALGNLRRDKDCLIAAGVWDEHHGVRQSDAASKTDSISIALSTRFALKPQSRFQATDFTSLIKNEDFIRTGNFVMYSPNAFDKATCDPMGVYTNICHTCRGTMETCQ